MKKILIVCSSPRIGGNSTLLASQFASGAEAAGHTVETIMLNEDEPGYCQACEYCLSHSGQCFQQDIMNSVRDRLTEADVLVFATPVYFYSMSAQMKAFIDRTYGFYSRIKAQSIYLLASSADGREEAADGALAGLRGFADCIGKGCRIAGVVRGVGVSAAGDVRHTAAFDEAYEMGKSV